MRAPLLPLLTALTLLSVCHAGDPSPATAPAGFYPREGNPSWRGDCNRDRNANIVDALFAARHGAGLVDLGTPVSQGGDCTGTVAQCEAVFRGCDVNDSGAIDSVDALMIAQMDVTLIPQGIEATLINVVPHSPDPSGGVADPHPINDAAPPNPVVGRVCLHYHMTIGVGPASADVAVEYSTAGGAPGTFLPATLYFGAGGTTPGSAGPAPHVVTGVPTDAAGASVNTIVWDSTADIPLPDQLNEGLPGVVLRLRPMATFASPTVPGNIERTQPFQLGNEPPFCNIVDPQPSATVSGQVGVVFDLWDTDLVTDPWPAPPYPATDYTTATIYPEYSTDAGVTWATMADAGAGAGSEGTTGLSMGPLATLPQQHTFVWDSQADLPNLNLVVNLRIRVEHAVDVFTGPVTATSDVVDGNSCDVAPVDLVNNTAPECVINLPAGGSTVGGLTLVDFDLRDPGGDPLTVTWEYSTDGGSTFALITLAAGGTINLNPAPGIFSGAVPPTPPPFQNYTVNWDTGADIPGFADPVDLRLTLDDGRDITQCVVQVAVDNRPSCTNVQPTLASGVQSGVVPVTWDSFDADGGPLNITMRYSTDGGTIFNLCTVVSSGPFATNPVLSVLPGPGQGMDWDTIADGLTDNPGTIVEIEVDDGTTVSTCTTIFDVLNNIPPECLVLTVSPPTPTGVIALNFDTYDRNPGDLHIVTVEYTTDFGLTYALATPAPGSPLSPNPTGFVPPGPGQVFLWDAATDVPASSTVEIRISLEDTGGLFAFPPCTATFFVDNRPECREPAAPGLNPSPVSGDYDFVIEVRDLSSDAVDLTWDYSTDGGLTYQLMTPYAGGPVALNPSLGVPRTNVFAPITFGWSSAADIPGGALSTVLRLTVFDGTTTVSCQIVRDVVNDPTCAITAPTGGREGGDVTISITTTAPTVVAAGFAGLSIDFEYSTDAGVTFFAMTDSGTGSLVGNPALQPLPGAATFGWNSPVDIAGAAAVEVRVTVTDVTFGGSTTCTAAFDVDNVPTCVVTAPAGGVEGGDITVALTTSTLAADSPTFSGLSVALEYSTDAGGTYLPMSESFTGSLTGNPALQPLPAVDTWGWDSLVDIAGQVPNVVARLTVTDQAFGASSPCQSIFEVDNLPHCVITSPTGGTFFGDVPIDFTTTSLAADSPSYNDLDFAWAVSTDAGLTFAPMTDAGGGTVTGNPGTQSPSPASDTWVWDSPADVQQSSRVQVQMTITDRFAGGTTTCSTVFDIDNRPTCVINTPIAGTEGGEVIIDITTTAPTSTAVGFVGLSVLFEYSTDAGVTFFAMTDTGGGSLSPNPSTQPLPGPATFGWDSLVDINTFSPVEIRVTVTDIAYGSTNTCTAAFDVDNVPTCVVNSPAGGVEGGDVLVDLTTATLAFDSPSFAGLSLLVEFSTDAGGTFQLASNSGTGSLVGNPALQAAPGGDTFGWDSLLDQVANVAQVIIRVTATDAAFGASSDCQTIIDINNLPSCSVVSPAGGVDGGEIIISLDTFSLAADSPSFTGFDLLFDHSTNAGGTFGPMTDSLGGGLTGNPAYQPLPGPATWGWDSLVDIDQQAPNAIVRITIVDQASGLQTECQTIFDVDNVPTCAITAPRSGIYSSDVLLSFTTTTLAFDSPSYADLGFAWAVSTDAGLTFVPMTDAGGGTVTGNPGTQSPSPASDTWVWDSPREVPGVTQVLVRLTITDAFAGGSSTCDTVFDVDNAPTCVVNAPLAGIEGGDVTIDITSTAPSAAAAGFLGLSVLFEYSTDAGVTFFPMTSSGTGSLAVNPATQLVPGGDTFGWDSPQNLPAAAAVEVRVTVTDIAFGGTSSCSAAFQVDNVPTCSITAPAGGLEGGDVTIELTSLSLAADSPTFAGLDLLLEYSSDAGGTFNPATESLTGTITGSPALGVPVGPETWGWDSLLDIPGQAPAVMVRLTVTDQAFGGTTTCQTTFDVDNLPTCTITAPIAGDTVSGVRPISFDSASLAADSPSFANLVAALEYSTNSGVSFLPMTDAGSGGLTGNPTGPFPPGPQTWDWLSYADIAGQLPSVVARVTVTDGLTALGSTCQVEVNLDNLPTCTITAPAPLSVLTGLTSMQFTTVSPSGNPLDLTLEYSTDSGVTFFPATDGGGGALTGNPVLGAVAGASDWQWDTNADIGAVASSVIFRLTVADSATAATTFCTVVVDIANNEPPECLTPPVVVGPATGGELTLEFTTFDGDGDLLEVLVEYSEDGIFFNTATVGLCGGSMTSNPELGLAPGLTSLCWDTGADIPGVSSTVTLRVTLDDGIAPPVTTGCITTGLTIDNRPTCALVSPAPGTTVGGTVPVIHDLGDPDGNLLDVRFRYSTNGGATFFMATPAIGANPSFALPGAAQVFEWDSETDIPTRANPTILRLEVFDGTSTTTCDLTLDVHNNTPPSCVVVSPLSGDVVGGNVPIVFDAIDVDLDPLDLRFHFSTDGGATWILMSRGPGSTIANPDFDIAPAPGLTFIWASSYDLPGYGGGPCGSGADGSLSLDAAAGTPPFTIGTDGGVITDANGTVVLTAASGTGTFEFIDFSIAAGITVRALGANPLVITAAGTVTIDGILDASGGDGGDAPVGASAVGGGPGTPGAGGYQGGAGAGYYPGSGVLSGNPGIGAGGGGGGLWPASGAGGGAGHLLPGTPGGGAGGGFGGPAYIVPPGGSGGGGGSGVDSALAPAVLDTSDQGGAGGGGGGGIVRITCGGVMTIGGSIDVSGGNGGNAAGGGDAGGGGSGGTIELNSSAAIPTVTGSLLVNGGTGGLGGSGGGQGQAGPAPVLGLAPPCSPPVCIRVTVDDTIDPPSTCQECGIIIDTAVSCTITSAQLAGGAVVTPFDLAGGGTPTECAAGLLEIAGDLTDEAFAGLPVIVPGDTSTGPADVENYEGGTCAEPWTDPLGTGPPADPPHGPAHIEASASGPEDIWIFRTGPEGLLELEVLPDLAAGALTDSVLYVREGSCDGPEVACDDNSGVPHPAKLPEAGNLSRLTFLAQANTTYYIFVDGWGSDRGTYDLLLNYTSEPRTIGGTATITYDVAGAAVTATHLYSVDGGLTWLPATDDLGGPHIVPRTAGTGYVYVWDTDGDLGPTPYSAIFRVDLSSGAGTSVCDVLIEDADLDGQVDSITPIGDPLRTAPPVAPDATIHPSVTSLCPTFEPQPLTPPLGGPGGLSEQQVIQNSLYTGGTLATSKYNQDAVLSAPPQVGTHNDLVWTMALGSEGWLTLEYTQAQGGGQDPMVSLWVTDPCDPLTVPGDELAYNFSGNDASGLFANPLDASIAIPLTVGTTPVGTTFFMVLDGQDPAASAQSNARLGVALEGVLLMGGDIDVHYDIAGSIPYDRQILFSVDGGGYFQPATPSTGTIFATPPAVNPNFGELPGAYYFRWNALADLGPGQTAVILRVAADPDGLGGPVTPVIIDRVFEVRNP